MDLEKIFNWILSKPQNYPGKHQVSQPRTDPSHKPLEPKAQFHIIFKAVAAYIKEKMIEGKVIIIIKGVNIKDFGAFSFEVYSDTVQSIQFSNFNTTGSLNEQRKERQHVHRIRPCFVSDTKLRTQLTYYNNKEEIQSLIIIQASNSQHSIYQKGFQMIFCNSGPIAAACYLANDVVTNSIQAFINAIVDLVAQSLLLILDRDLQIEFGFCKLSIVHKSISYKFQESFVKSLNQKDFEQKMRKSDLQTKQHWGQTYEEKWNKSALNTILRKPDHLKTQEILEKTIGLKIMSLDLNTTEKIQK